jgi:hypothetical protein
MERIYNYVFHFNYMDNTWNAFTREQYKDYFNGELSKDKVLKSKNIMTLVGVIKKMEEVEC